MQSPTPDPAERPSAATGEPVAPSSAVSPASAEPAAAPAPESRPAYPPAVLAAPSAVPAAPVPTPAAGARVPASSEASPASGDGSVAPGAVPPSTTQPAAAAGNVPVGAPAAAGGPVAAGDPVAPGCGPAVDALMRQREAVTPPPPFTPEPPLFTPEPPLFPPPLAERRGPRPATVTVAVILQYVVVALLVAMVGLLIWEGVTYGLLIDEAADTPGASQFDAAAERAGNWSMNGVAIALLVLLAGWLLTNTLLTARGNNVTRILNVAGLGAALGLVVLGACSGGLLTALPFSSTGYGASDPYAEYPFDEESSPALPPSSGDYYHENAFYDRLTDLVAERNSVAFDAGMPLLGVIAVFLAITVMVLLLVPSANRWFNPARPAPAPRPQPWPPHAAYNAQLPVPPQPFAPQPFPVPHFGPQPGPYVPAPQYQVPPLNFPVPQPSPVPPYPAPHHPQPVQQLPVPPYPAPQYPVQPPPITPGQPPVPPR